MKIWTVYIIKSDSRDKYYIGVTNNLKQRLREHNNNLSPYTKGGSPWLLVHYEEFNDIQNAYQRERFIKKKKSRKILEGIISSPDVLIAGRIKKSGSRLRPWRTSGLSRLERVTDNDEVPGSSPGTRTITHILVLGAVMTSPDNSKIFNFVNYRGFSMWQ